MNDLPDEIISKILNYTSKKSRLVCHRFEQRYHGSAKIIIQYEWTHPQGTEEYKIQRYTEIGWVFIVRQYNLDEEFINTFSYAIGWDLIVKYQILTESTMVSFMDQFIHFRNINHSDSKMDNALSKLVIYQILSEEFIDKYWSFFEPPRIVKYQILSEEFVIKHPEILDLYLEDHRIILSNNFIRIFHKRLPWDSIMRRQLMTEDILIEFNECFTPSIWYVISKSQKLSEQFIERFQDKLEWTRIAQNQILSEPFIERFQDKLDWTFVIKYQTISRKLFDKIMTQKFSLEYFIKN